MNVDGSLTDLNPQPGMPIAWRTNRTSWTKKMKKKTKKLNELSLLQRERKGSVGKELGLEKQNGTHPSPLPFHHPHSPFLPESLIHGAVPTDEGAGGEKEDPEDREPKA